MAIGATLGNGVAQAGGSAAAGAATAEKKGAFAQVVDGVKNFTKNAEMDQYRADMEAQFNEEANVEGDAESVPNPAHDKEKAARYREEARRWVASEGLGDSRIRARPDRLMDSDNVYDPDVRLPR